jgi:hypothetical protein
MLWWPLNDHECLAHVTLYVAENVYRPNVVALATRFRTTTDLVEWLRSLPQRNDDGDTSDGPRLQCDVSQRARIAPNDPNCFERSLTYLLLAEHINPWALRQLATIDTKLGRHTLPLENGEPVILDPRQVAGASEISASVAAVRNNGRASTQQRVRLPTTPDGQVIPLACSAQSGVSSCASPRPSTAPTDAVAELGAVLAWICDVAEYPSHLIGGDEGLAVVRYARTVLDEVGLLATRPLGGCCGLSLADLRAGDSAEAVRASVALVWTLIMAGIGSIAADEENPQRLYAVDVARQALDRLGLLIDPEHFVLALHVAPRLGDRVYEALAQERRRNGELDWSQPWPFPNRALTPEEWGDVLRHTMILKRYDDAIASVREALKSISSAQLLLLPPGWYVRTKQELKELERYWAAAHDDVERETVALNAELLWGRMQRDMDPHPDPRFPPRNQILDPYNSRPRMPEVLDPYPSPPPRRMPELLDPYPSTPVSTKTDQVLDPYPAIAIKVPSPASPLNPPAVQPIPGALDGLDIRTAPPLTPKRTDPNRWSDDPEEDALWAGIALAQRLKEERRKAGRRNWDKSDWQGVFSVIHGIGKGVLSIWGLGGLGDTIGGLEKQAGLLPPDKKPAPQQSAPQQQSAPATDTAGALSSPAMQAILAKLTPSEQEKAKTVFGSLSDEQRQKLVSTLGNMPVDQAVGLVRGQLGKVGGGGGARAANPSTGALRTVPPAIPGSLDAIE